MTKIKVVTDSSVQMTPEEIKQYDVTVIPLSIMIDNTVYVDGVTIQRDEFVEKMNNSNSLPTTSQPAIGTMVDKFNELTADGSSVLGIFMAESLSGTVNSARQAAEMADGDVTVVDSEFTDRAMSFQVIEAAKLAEQGASMATILDTVKQVEANTTLRMAVVDLTNIVKGGRLSKAAGMIGSLLNIKVTLSMENGKLEILKKGRGMKTIRAFKDEVIQTMSQLPDVKGVGVSYVGIPEDAQAMGEEIRQALPGVEVLVRTTTPVVATHAGQGAFAILYYEG
ncbi:DegV family protein [Lacticaseibacillus songhuajiangensis]|jgi:DegV family protein with EDD domain|uniref:DegV family protein n=1 Tax=Lacticaseibacillus songhuajiangensis TaxID=1296539 RepID=UPI000F7862A8|nr:DegV family protein [Lacticaseibacillus songhuajiangensis]MCI1283233.1 DegV family protein [Lacticaseibacillus songhuajiangensis]